MAKDHRLEVIEHCEEFTGMEEAEQLRMAFATGFLAGGQAREPFFGWRECFFRSDAAGVEKAIEWSDVERSSLSAAR